MSVSQCQKRSARSRRWAPAIAVSAVLLVAGCGGGGSGGVDGMSIVEQESPENFVLRSDSPELTTKGAFESFDGYLSESARVLRSDGGDSSATFRISIPRSGYYEVFAWWPRTGGEGSFARITVTHPGGKSTIRVDQSVDGGGWNSLGVYALDENGEASVAWASENGAPMLVDAVRVQYVGDERPQLRLGNTELPVGEQGAMYSAPLLGAGGIPPYAFRLLEGALPAGLELDVAAGSISGIPAFPGSHSFSLEVVDSTGHRGVAQASISVVEPMSPLISGSAVTKSSVPGETAMAAKSAAGSLLSVIQAMPEGEWSKVNLNQFSDVWAPADLRPLLHRGNPEPSKIIIAWSSFAWDANRGNLILYGGGHANYRGNDVYIWRGSTRMWERASLPSESVQDALGNIIAIDGADAAPASAHTYDNNIFLPIHDRMLVLGGAAEANGGHFYRQHTATTSRITGPYLFDPSRADPWKVGGTTGSHVQRVSPYPEIVGGGMWSNRENWLNASLPPSQNFVNDCTGYAEENGKDVVYVRNYNLYKYTIPNLGDSTQDKWEIVGRFWGGPGDKVACGVDPGKTFVRTATNSVPFVYWNLQTPGAKNNDVKLTPTDPTGEFESLLASNAITMRDCGLDFDRPRGRYALWCGGGRVWMLEPPATISPNGWIIRKQPTPIGPAPTADVGTGILGKWEYAPDLDAFVALQDPVQGNVWIYKPVGWQNPGGGDGGGGDDDPPPNVPPSVQITQPANASSFVAGQPLTVSAVASDADGSVARVRFFRGSTEIGQAVSPPYAISWTSPPVGTFELKAIATDDRGAETISASVTVTFTSPPTGGGATVVLQNGLNGYAGAMDTYLSYYHQSLSFGGAADMHDKTNRYPILVRFRIFQSEGGPVPVGATIQSAKLELYKYSAYDTVYSAHRLLKNWSEESATWNQSGPSVGWSVPGAFGAGTDYRSTSDATASAPWESAWVEFDVTGGIQEISNAGGVGNYGWRLNGVSGTTSGIKRFYSSQYSGDSSLRPRLTITYR